MGLHIYRKIDGSFHNVFSGCTLSAYKCCHCKINNVSFHSPLCKNTIFRANFPSFTIFFFLSQRNTDHFKDDVQSVKLKKNSQIKINHDEIYLWHINKSKIKTKEHTSYFDLSFITPTFSKLLEIVCAGRKCACNGPHV